MARTKKEIEDSLSASVKDTDPSLDTAKGALRSLMLAPVAPVAEVLEGQLEHLTGLFSSAFKEEATAEEVDALATSFSIARNLGKKATVIQHFVRFSQPALNEILTVPKGTLVSNANGSLVYQTLEEVSIDGNNASAFFNAARNSYEVSTKIEAVSSGVEFNLPSFRINKLTTALTGFDLTENRRDALGGSSEETDRDLATRVETKFKGLNTGTPNGIKSLIQDKFPLDVKDLAIIQPRDQEFKRLINGLALDVFIIGATEEIVEETFVAQAGDLTFLLGVAPALAINSATLNGVTTTVGLSPDTNPEVQGSINEQASVVFPTPLQANDIVVLNYTVNSLITSIQTLLTDRLFDTNILARSALPVELILEARVSVVASADTLSIQTQIESKIKEFIELNVFQQILLPNIIEEKLRNNIVGISNFRWTKFTKQSGGFLDVELLELNRNEIPKIKDENFKVTVTRV